MSEILPHKLYLGSIYDAENTDWILQHKVRDVITVINGYDTNNMTEWLTTHNIQHHVYDVGDHSKENLSVLFSEIIRLIDASETVLVHCGMGISRSATVVIAYLMYSERMYLDAALQFVLSKRLCIFPNDGFIIQLIEFEKSIFGSMTYLPNAEGIRKFKSAIHSYSD